MVCYGNSQGCRSMKKILLLLILMPVLFINGIASNGALGFTFTYDTKSVRIPVEIQHNIILIPLRINGSFEMNFILDTGVRTTMLTETMVAGFLNLDTLSTVKVRGLGEGDPIEAALARNVSISLPGVEGSGINLIVLPEGVISYSGLFGKPVYGIIGYEIFRQFVVEINYTQKFVKQQQSFPLIFAGQNLM